MSVTGLSDPNSEQTNDANYEHGGSFDLNNGRMQTRLFAEAFHRHINVNMKADFTVLDVGCGLGDALPVWRKYYPNSKLFGCDFSGTAIRRCNETYGNIATFFRARFEDIAETYDVIYCSNVLEHFECYLQIAELLHRRCQKLYILVPYMELRNGMPICSESDYYHKATFSLSSFDAMKSSKRSVSGRVIRAPGAWSPTIIGEIKWFLRRVVARRPGFPPRQALFELNWNEGSK
jgi:SAM-dependent methyltransferase